MQRDLRIPYATNERTGETVLPADLAGRLVDLRATIRLDATLDHDTATRRATPYLCPVCCKPVYPHAPRIPNGRHFWVHRHKSAKDCPLARRRQLSPDEINRLIFNGVQEGEAHKSLVALLAGTALNDPLTVKDSLRIGKYEPPTDEMRGEFPHGRFPDVAFTYAGDRVVLEAQLATITLYGINGRRAYYDRHGSVLLWVTRHFDPSGPMRHSFRDILADQNGLLLSIDKKALATSAETGTFHLHLWRYELLDGEPLWTSEVLPLADVIKIARPRLWSDDFKERFIEAYDGKNFWHLEKQNPLLFLNEAMRKIGHPEYNKRSEEADGLLVIMRLLISLETGRPVGSAHAALISLANSFYPRSGHRYRSLVLTAIKRWRPDLLMKPSMRFALEQAKKTLMETGDPQYDRTSKIGQLRDLLFPKWDIGPVAIKPPVAPHAVSSPSPLFTVVGGGGES